MGEVVTPRLSVIIPVKDDPRVARCLDALADQTLDAAEFEIIVVDNDAAGSAQPFAAAAPVRYERHPQGGSYAARGHGAALALGDVLVFTDADCVPPPTWLETIRDLFEDASRQVVIGPSSGTSDSVVSEWVQGIDETRWRGLLGQADIAFCDTRNLAIRRSTFEAVGFDPAFRQAGDIDLGIRVQRAGVSIAMAEQMRLRHDHPQSLIAVLRRAIRRGRGIAQLERKHGTLDIPTGQRPLRLAGLDLKGPVLAVTRIRPLRPVAIACLGAAVALLTPVLAVLARLGGAGGIGRRLFVAFERLSLLLGRVLG